MAAPILWAPVIVGLFLLEKKTHAHKIPCFGGGGGWKSGGGSANVTFMGTGKFSEIWGLGFLV